MFEMNCLCNAGLMLANIFSLQLNGMNVKNM